MAEVIQNVLYMLTQGAVVSRDHLTLLIEVPVYPDDLPAGEQSRDKATDFRKLSIPIHHVESACLFGAVTMTPQAMGLCHEHGVAVSFLSEHGHLRARVAGVPDSSVSLRRAHFRAADDRGKCLKISRNIVAGKIQNSRNSLLRAGREAPDASDGDVLSAACERLARLLPELEDSPSLDHTRGIEGAAAQAYFDVFNGFLKQQREDFCFTTRTRFPPRDRINCLLSFAYALVRHDCIAALTAIGLDPFVGFLHAERPNRPALALDLMEEFRSWLADRLVITLVNRQQIGPSDVRMREGGVAELTEAGRKTLIKAYQERKQETLRHTALDQNLRIGQIPFVQARILARVLRGDLTEYLPFLPK